MTNDGIRRARPTVDTPLGDLIAGKIDQAEYRRRMALKGSGTSRRVFHTDVTGGQHYDAFDPRNAPDPLRHLDTDLDPRVPEPHRPVRSTDYAGDLGCSTTVLLLVAIATLVGSSIALFAAPRSAPIPTSPQPGASGAIDSVGASGRVKAAASGWAPITAPLGSQADETASATIYGAVTPAATRSPVRPAGVSSPVRTSTPAPLDAVTRSGIATNMGHSPAAGPRYLALPMGPGWLVRICGPAGCDDVVSTDAGPERWLQRPPHNRIADLSIELFEQLCGVPWRFGYCDISWTVERRP